MKKASVIIIAVLCMLSILAVSNAVFGKERVDKETWLSMCKVMSESAEAVMGARQRGVSMETMVSVFQEKIIKTTPLKGAAKELLEEMITKMIIMAYERPQFSTQEYKDRAVKQFGNMYYLECIKHLYNE